MKSLYFPVCDNESAFYAFINLVINNRHNKFEGDPTIRPHDRIGKITKFTYTRNEVGEQFIVVYSKQDYSFLEMIETQFCLLRTYWVLIEDSVYYPASSKFEYNPGVEP